MGKIIRCTDCLYNIDVNKDPFCLVTPHGQRYSHKEYIPLCPDCRFEQGYDIRANYHVVREFKQPSVPRLEYKPFTEQIALENLERTSTPASTPAPTKEEIVTCMSMSNQQVETA